jgi:hypothetical protein
MYVDSTNFFSSQIFSSQYSLKPFLIILRTSHLIVIGTKQLAIVVFFSRLRTCTLQLARSGITKFTNNPALVYVLPLFYH